MQQETVDLALGQVPDLVKALATAILEVETNMGWIVKQADHGTLAACRDGLTTAEGDLGACQRHLAQLAQRLQV